MVRDDGLPVFFVFVVGTWDSASAIVLVHHRLVVSSTAVTAVLCSCLSCPIDGHNRVRRALPLGYHSAYRPVWRPSVRGLVYSSAFTSVWTRFWSR